MSRRVLFVTPEIAPLNKVGGLGDVAHGLVGALRREGSDARVLMPAYPDVTRRCDSLVARAAVTDARGREGQLLEARCKALGVPLYLADFPHHFEARTSPYGDWDSDTPADAHRFAAFARAAAAIARGALADWRPEVVHCNDWTTGLVPVLLRRLSDDPAGAGPATVFTIHNLAHQGLFSRDCFDDLGLPPELWSLHGLEFHGRMSFLKGGLVYSDRINTVSPTYAREIRSHELGCGLEGLLEHRRDRLSGILNGIDHQVWNPETDPALAAPFSLTRPDGKARCKTDLQCRLGLEADADVPVVGLVSRLTFQKGVDLIAEAWERILELGVQMVVLGTGDPALESTLSGRADDHPGRSAVRLLHDETLAHRIIAGADMFLMPSRFEPCGLTQLYSLRYGTVPVAARTGGLLDTVMPARTGFLFDPGLATSMLDALGTALGHFRGPDWHRIREAGMRADFGWPRSARQYGALYEQAVRDRAAGIG